MPKHHHPEDGMVYACPACDRAGNLYRREGQSNAKDDSKYRCRECLTSFDEVVERESQATTDNAPTGPRSGVGARIADPKVGPENLGLSPTGEVPSSRRSP